VGIVTSTLRVEVDPTAVSLAGTIAEAARFVPFLVIGGRMLADLADELGGMDAATRHLLAVATSVDTPIAVNVESGPDTSSTAVIAPRSWSQERLAGWIGGKREALVELFGEVTVREDV
jgi:hypothetical protein